MEKVTMKVVKVGIHVTLFYDCIISAPSISSLYLPIPDLLLTSVDINEHSKVGWFHFKNMIQSHFILPSCFGFINGINITSTGWCYVFLYGTLWKSYYFFLFIFIIKFFLKIIVRNRCAL